MNLDELKKLKIAYETALREKGQEILKETFKKFFDENPDLIALRWEQYTPYFNDGESCTFGVHDLYAKYTGGEGGAEEETGDDDDAGFDYIRSGHWYGDRASPQWLCDVQKEFKSFPEDLLEAAFGDHAKITATRDGFDVEECSHD
jgi:hypothetical protein